MTPRGPVLIGSIDEVHEEQRREWLDLDFQGRSDLFTVGIRAWKIDEARLRQVLSSLETLGVEFLIVGSFAMSVHACPRITRELECWIRPCPVNGLRFAKALSNLSVQVDPHQAKQFGEAEGQVLVVEEFVPALRFINSLPGLSFDEAYERRIGVRSLDTSVSVLSLEDLVIAKRASREFQDRYDLADIGEVHSAFGA